MNIEDFAEGKANAKVKHCLDDGSEVLVDCFAELLVPEMKYWVDYVDPENEDHGISGFADEDEVFMYKEHNETEKLV